MTTTIPPRRTALHEAICRCENCRGTCDRARLCERCKRWDRELDGAKKEKFVGADGWSVG
jgi:hypothetical protein